MAHPGPGRRGASRPRDLTPCGRSPRKRQSRLSRGGAGRSRQGFTSSSRRGFANTARPANPHGARRIFSFRMAASQRGGPGRHAIPLESTIPLPESIQRERPTILFPLPIKKIEHQGKRSRHLRKTYKYIKAKGEKDRGRKWRRIERQSSMFARHCSWLNSLNPRTHTGLAGFSAFARRNPIASPACHGSSAGRAAGRSTARVPVRTSPAAAVRCSGQSGYARIGVLRCAPVVLLSRSVFSRGMGTNVSACWGAHGSGATRGGGVEAPPIMLETGIPCGTRRPACIIRALAVRNPLPRAWLCCCCGRVAQLVEHRTFNPVAAGSSPAPFTRITSTPAMAYSVRHCGRFSLLSVSMAFSSVKVAGKQLLRTHPAHRHSREGGNPGWRHARLYAFSGFPPSRE